MECKKTPWRSGRKQQHKYDVRGFGEKWYSNNEQSCDTNKRENWENANIGSKTEKDENKASSQSQHHKQNVIPLEAEKQDLK